MVKIGIIIAVLVFGIIVLLHELGHFAMAKLNGIYVHEFAIGMGYRLFSIQGKETKYSLCLLPIGGYCDMYGENERVEGDDAFCNKTVLQRMSVILAGPLMNFFLALIIILGIAFAFGYTSTTIDTVRPDSPAMSVGLESGDQVIGINNHRVSVYEDIPLYVNTAQDKENLQLTVLRNGEELVFNVKPELSPETNTYLIGFSPARAQKDFIGVVKYSFNKMVYYVKTVFLSLKLLVTGEVSFKQMAGPVGIVNIISDNYNAGIQVSFLAAIVGVLNITALLSANLFVLNLLPIPALDGSHMVYLIIEGIRGKPVSEKIQYNLNRIGFTLLMVLMVVVLFNDVINIANK